MRKNALLVFLSVFLIVLVSLSVVSAASNKGYTYEKSIRKYTEQLEDLADLIVNYENSIDAINDRIDRDRDDIQERLVYWQNEYDKEAEELDAECNEKVIPKDIAECWKQKANWLKKLESWKEKDMKNYYRILATAQKDLVKKEKALAKAEAKYDKYESKLEATIIKYGAYLWANGVISPECRDEMETGVMCDEILELKK